MIDSSIYKVYKENQQVFIPEFGAIIQSEVSDSPSFNAMLNFDDGKVIEAIMEKQSISEDEARVQLQEHVQMIKDKLDEGKTHYVRGLGHIYKDELDSYAVSKKKPSLDFSSGAIVEDEPVAEDTELLDTAQEDLDTTFESTESDNQEDSTLEEFPTIDDTEEDTGFSSFMSNADEDLENQVENTDEVTDHEFDIASEDNNDDFSLSDESESTDFNENSEDTSWQDDDSEFSYDEENFEDDESGESGSFYQEESKGNRVFLTLTAAVILLFIVSAVGYYFLFYKTDDKAADQKTEYNTALASAKDKDAKKETKKAATTAKEVKASPASNQQANSVSANQYANGQGPAYSVILGSFKVENNANNFQRYLQERGMQVAIFRRDNDFHFVGFEEIPGKTNAMGLLSEMRSEEPTAWIIRK